MLEATRVPSPLLNGHGISSSLGHGRMQASRYLGPSPILRPSAVLIVKLTQKRATIKLNIVGKASGQSGQAIALATMVDGLVRVADAPT